MDDMRAALLRDTEARLFEAEAFLTEAVAIFVDNPTEANADKMRRCLQHYSGVHAQRRVLLDAGGGTAP